MMRGDSVSNNLLCYTKDLFKIRYSDIEHIRDSLYVCLKIMLVNFEDHYIIDIEFSADDIVEILQKRYRLTSIKYDDSYNRIVIELENENGTEKFTETSDTLPVETLLKVIDLLREKYKRLLSDK